MKRYPGHRLLLLTGILLLSVSCQEDRIVPDSKPTTPPSFREIVAAYRDGKTYVETRTLTTFSKVFFQDGGSVVAMLQQASESGNVIFLMTTTFL